ncbi:MAG: transporter substrate-binding domain-containing protein [Methylococcales symbiont of Hymedesmia sp. n. MRB-2018]|nr:MAG: transporter substrate-binding domain-containing protein [Methylococcales symbiont of Hymedesmia sp. n. MRB-2018]KAF3984122.1 MAG: transporter substrate-binding domain-containing protein [Methylococcales symbiont of Hymedesmia sp. n. MRB-2018]
MKLKITLLILSILFSGNSYCTEKLTIRLGILAFGTVNWELSALKNLNLLENTNFQLEIHPVANPQAGKIALQAGAVDIIVSDWVWVSRLRSTGADFTFYPYSTTSGALMVPENSNIRSLQDLSGKKLGIAGGEMDKNWLLLQALGQQYKINLNQSVEKVYAAPPLLNQQIIRGRVDAVINYWHFAAKLEAQNYRQIINGKEILQQLGIKQIVPTLGYVFNRQWADQYKTEINQFLKSTQTAKNQLCQSDSVWADIVSLTRVKDLITQTILRQRYCLGRIQQWGKQEQQAAEKIYTLLKNLSNKKLTGHSDTLHTGTFWTIDEP